MKTLIRNSKEYISVPGSCDKYWCPFSNAFDECGVPCDLSLTKEHWVEYIPLIPKFELNTKDLSETEVVELKKNLDDFIIRLTTRNDIKD